jgi:hypothetical protein
VALSFQQEARTVDFQKEKEEDMEKEAETRSLMTRELLTAIHLTDFQLRLLPLFCDR